MGAGIYLAGNFPGFLFDEYSALSADMSNYTFNSIIKVPAVYLPDAYWNLGGCVWGIFPNMFILIIGVSKVTTGRFKQSIIGMSACQLYAGITQTLLYSLYLWAHYYKIEMSVMMCSIPRRIFQQTINVALLSLLIISIDRYLSIIRGKALTKRAVTFLFLVPAMYAHGVYNTLTIAPMNLGTSDMCGPCLKMPESVSYYLEPVVPICVLLAVLINCRILWFLFTYKKLRQKQPKVTVVYNDKELNDLKHAMIGIMLQACIPLAFNMPQNINLAMYNISAAFRLEKDAWRVINCLNYFTLFLNPCVTLMFVKQFRLAALRFVGKSVSSSSVEMSVKSRATEMKSSYGPTFNSSSRPTVIR